ncbi:MAG: VTT domain-containing protein [Anaerolineae bacterium]|nr:VTT domain-containing protein [Anaerolineae bacterium]
MDFIVTLLQNFWLSLQSGQLSEQGVWIYLVLVVIVAVEGPIATLLGAAAASAGYLQLNGVFAAAFVGNLTADLSWYTLGYLGKIEWILRLGKRFGLNPKLLEHVQQGLADHATKLLIVAKLTAAFTIPMLIAAGLSRLPLKRWLPGYMVAEAIWTGGLVAVGFYATEAITQVEHGIQGLSIIAGLVFIIVGILFLRRKLRNRELDRLLEPKNRA